MLFLLIVAVAWLNFGERCGVVTLVLHLTKADLVKGIRSHKKNEKEYIQKQLNDIKDEFKSTYTLATFPFPNFCVSILPTFEYGSIIITNIRYIDANNLFHNLCEAHTSKLFGTCGDDVELSSLIERGPNTHPLW